MNKLKKEQRTLKQLGWKIYKKRRHEIIYSKHNNNTLIILNRDSECVSFKDVHSLTFEEAEQIWNEQRMKGLIGR